MSTQNRLICTALIILTCILPAASQVQPCQQGTFANAVETSCSVDSLILNFQNFVFGGGFFSQDGVTTSFLITPSDIGFTPVQVNGLSGFKLDLNFVTGPGANSTFVGDQLLQFNYTPQSVDGFEIRAVQLQIDATAQAPPGGTAIVDALDFQTYPNTGFLATDAFFAIDPSFNFPPEHLTDHIILEVPSTLSTGVNFSSLTTQISEFVLGTGSTNLRSASFLFQMEPIVPAPPAAPLAYTNIDLPGQPSTFASNINNLGQIVGSYQDSLGARHGFVTEKRGGFSTIDFPGAASTSAFGINDQGDVVGLYTDNAGITHGYLSAHGNLSALDCPGSIFTVAFAINNRDQIVGECDLGDGPLHGYLFADGNFTLIDQGVVPNGFSFTEAIGINNRGEIGGDFFDPNLFRGFIERNSAFQAFEVPSQADLFFGGINDPGDFVGVYFDTQFVEHGFLNSQGKFLTVDFPGAATSFALGINASGTIVGEYDNGDGVFHSFLAQPGANNGPGAQSNRPAVRHTTAERPVCGSAEWRQLAQNGHRAVACKPGH